MEEELVKEFNDFLSQLSIAPSAAPQSEGVAEELDCGGLVYHVIEHVSHVPLAPVVTEEVGPTIQCAEPAQPALYAGCLEAVRTAKVSPTRLQVPKKRQAVRSIAPFRMPTGCSIRAESFGCVLEAFPLNASGLRIEPVLMHSISPPSESVSSAPAQGPTILNAPLFAGIELRCSKPEGLRMLMGRLATVFIGRSACINLLSLPDGYAPSMSSFLVRTKRLPVSAPLLPFKPLLMRELHFSEPLGEPVAHGSADPIAVINLTFIQQSWLVDVLFELGYKLVERPLREGIPHLWDAANRCFVFMRVSELDSVHVQMVCFVRKFISVIVGSGNDMAK
jgi:hypothetical protein